MALGYEHYVKLVRGRERQLKKHSAQIGRMCTLWSSLELDVAVFLTIIVSFPDAPSKNALMGLMEFRDKLHALLALGFDKKPDDGWYDELADVINQINNPIRLERNRMVHDFWYSFSPEVGDAEIKRVQIKPKVVNVQSRTKRLVLADMKPVSATEIAQLCDKIIDAHAKLLVLQHRYEWRGSPGGKGGADAA
ncbi:hypothetical protein EN868_11215 [Mesorhizobium sp. M2D.F.Ca.ET.225.01.1.1]|uniref:hypothetical protein n=1 Tax=unclassified Mesorhizobium TaxID=325217 RepID=UPI000FD200F4|nr:MULTISPECIES: hypothetical protein [unclassified Mesorhizobium]TGP59554.1 hypothetical protein EN869_014885 [Mesorhizobium sp. M2D.F.Ca.ET.226.01.1.1]TGP69189.1 hypothetical protein EN868_11215 [Mesorhizobium sp. M2D.F.Ca.ET.225.01.1.1]